MSTLTMTPSGGAFCQIDRCAGPPVFTPGSGFTKCTLPFGSSVSTSTFSVYSPIVPKDMTSSTDHKLRDDAALGWQDLCDGTDANPTPGGGNCDPNPNPNSASGSATIVDANIQITPNGTNRVGNVHTFTGHVNVSCAPASATCVDDYTNAPAGTTINFAFVGASVGGLSAPSCLTVGTTGSCSITDTSTTTGVDTVRASTVVSVLGKPLTRATGDGKPVCLVGPPATCKVGQPGDGPDAVKTWVDARITIQQSGTNTVGQAHTFTVTIEKDAGDGNVRGCERCHDHGVGISGTGVGHGRHLCNGAVVGREHVHGDREQRHDRDGTVNVSADVAGGVGITIGGRDERLWRVQHLEPEDVGRCADHDPAVGHEPGRERAHVHGHDREGHRERARFVAANGATITGVAISGTGAITGGTCYGRRRAGREHLHGDREQRTRPGRHGERVG